MIRIGITGEILGLIIGINLSRTVRAVKRRRQKSL